MVWEGKGLKEWLAWVVGCGMRLWEVSSAYSLREKALVVVVGVRVGVGGYQYGVPSREEETTEH